MNATMTSIPATATEYAELGLPVGTGAQGILLFTNDDVCVISLPEALSDNVRRYLSANDLGGPVLTVVGHAELHLARGLHRASAAAAYLQEAGATIYANGDVVPLPPTAVVGGAAKWVVAPSHGSAVPPVVAISAAVRATTRRASLAAA